MRGITDITNSEIQWRVPSLTNTVACVSMLTCITWQCCPASPAGLQLHFKLPVHHVLPYVCLSCHHETVSLSCVSSVFHWQHIEFLDICIDVIVNDIGIGLALLLRIWNECEKPAPFCQLFVLLLLAAPAQPEACQLPCHWPGLPNYSEIQWRVPSLTNTVACVSMLTCITWQCCPASPAGLQLHFKLPVHHVLPYVCLSCHHVSLTCVSSVFHWQHILDICIDVIDIGIGVALLVRIWNECEKPAPFCQSFVLLLLAAPSQPEACQLPCHWPGLPNCTLMSLTMSLFEFQI